MINILLLLSLNAFAADATPVASATTTVSAPEKTKKVKTPAECAASTRRDRVAFCTGNIRGGNMTPESAVLLAEAVQDRELAKAESDARILRETERLAMDKALAKAQLVQLETESAERIELAKAEGETRRDLADVALVAVRLGQSLDAQVGDSRLRAGEAATEANKPDVYVVTDGYNQGNSGYQSRYPHVSPATGQFLDQMDPNAGDARVGSRR